jgi:riboflavin biosynthesis pyrimidine reductase
MSQDLSKPGEPEPTGGEPSAERSAIVVGADALTTDVGTALADRSVDVTHYDDPVVAVKGYDHSPVDCVVLSSASRGSTRILDRIATDETVVVRLADDRDTAFGDLVASPSEDAGAIADRILEQLADRAVDRQLARHDRLLRAVHEVTQATLGSQEVGEICTEACARLFESECYGVVWITRECDGEVVVESTAGIEPGVLSVPPEQSGNIDSGIVVAGSGGNHTASVPLVADGERQGTLGLSTTQRIDAAERDVLEDLGAVLGRSLASAEPIDPPTPGRYGFGSEEAARTAMQAVQNAELPPAFADVVDDYEDTFGRRDRFLWQWLHTVFPLFELSCIDDDHLETVRTAKLATSMLVVVLDDLGETPEQYATFQEAAAVPFEHESASLDREGVDPEPVAFVEDVWNVIVETLETAPEWETYVDTFRFDLRQVVTAVEYAHHVNEYPRVGNVTEAEAYGSHNMMMFPAADVDLMYAPSFDRDELADLRAVVHEAQKMGRIGNWLSTWERELAEGDVHAGTVLRALAEDAVDREDLERVGEDESIRERVVEEILASDSETALLERWEDHYRWIHRRTGDVETVDLSEFLSGMVEVFRYHRASRGLK